MKGNIENLSALTEKVYCPLTDEDIEIMYQDYKKKQVQCMTCDENKRKIIRDNKENLKGGFKDA